MKVNKKVIANLDKCYSIAPLQYNGVSHILVAAEKVDRCILFDLEGNEVDTVWTEPGGVMTMVQVPGTDGQFLATHKFYSPNDSKEARIVVVTPKNKGEWEVRVLVELPYVHRFDIINRSGINYLIACTLKSGHEYKEDWSMPGKVYVAVLPDDLSEFSISNQLELTPIKDNMLKNHGYCRTQDDGKDVSIICSNEGVFKFTPPSKNGDAWDIEHLLDIPASDAVWVDFDEDGDKELGVLSPFHGNQIMIYKRINNRYEKVYQYEKDADFTHSIYGGELCGRPAFVVGHRQSDRNLIAFTYNKSINSYESEIIDYDCGSANVYHYTRDEKDIILSTNREINEIAMYTLEA